MGADFRAEIERMMSAKGVTEDDLIAEGFGHLEDLDDDGAGDVVAWLRDLQHDDYREQMIEQEQDETARRDAIHERMRNEALAAGRSASRLQAEPDIPKGALYDRRVGGYRVTVIREGEDLVVTAWRGASVVLSKTETVPDEKVKARTQALASQMIQGLR